jgi:hypothetical protein
MVIRELRDRLRQVGCVTTKAPVTRTGASAVGRRRDVGREFWSGRRLR